MTDKKRLWHSSINNKIRTKNDSKKSPKKVRKIVGRVLTSVLAVIFLFAFVTLITLFVQISQGKQPSFFGYRLYVIMTDSMTPELEVKDVIIGKTVHFDNPEEALQIETGSVVTYIAAYGDQKGMSITHRVIESAHFDEEYARYVITTQGTKAGAAIDKPVPIENINAVMVRKSTAITALYSIISSSTGLLILFTIPMAFVIITLILRLIAIVRAPVSKDDLSDEEHAKEQAERALREKEIAERAVEEFIRTQQLHAPDTTANSPTEIDSASKDES